MTPSKSRLNNLSVRIKDMAREKGPDYKLPTTRELALALKTSTVTLNNALAELEAQNVIYRKPRSGIFVSPRIHHKSICLVSGPTLFSDSCQSPFWSILWDSLLRKSREEAARNDRTFSIHMSIALNQSIETLEESLVKMVRSGQVDGIIGVSLETRIVDWFIAHDVPYVAFAGDATWMVVLDSHDVAHLGIHSLARRGCQRIAVWQPVNAVAQRRSQGITAEYLARSLENEFAAAGAIFDPRLIRDNRLLSLEAMPVAPANQQQGHDIAMEVLGSGGDIRPDGILLMDDMMTVGALAAMNKLGIRPGKDICVATHANAGSNALTGYEDVLTRIEIPTEEVAPAMFGMLDILLAGKQPPEQRVVIKPQLIEA